MKTTRSTILRCLVFLACLLAAAPGIAQLDAGPDDTVSKGVPVTLTARYGLIGEGVTVSDDGVEGPFPIGFSFSFFGDVYTEFYIGANGWISFSPNPNAAGTREAFALPSPADYNPKNCILGPFQDLNPLQAGSPYIFYKTLGEAPARKLVVMWCQTPMFQCQDSTVTFQIILFEGSGHIENHILSKPACDEWLSNKATLGIQNATGYKGYAVPGYNATSWSAHEMAWGYTPSSADSFLIAPVAYALQPIVPGEKITYAWFCDGQQIASDASVTVAPNATTTYVARCTLCAGEVFYDTVTVFVIPYIPNAFTPNGDNLNDNFRMTGIPEENITRFNLQVFDRWGEAVFSTGDIATGWDGTFIGHPAPEGVYVWVMFYETGDKRKVTNKGTVLLVR
jgi:gliding motility-associated-like protein